MSGLGKPRSIYIRLQLALQYNGTVTQADCHYIVHAYLFRVNVFIDGTLTADQNFAFTLPLD